MSASHSPRLVLFFGAAGVFLSAATACGNGTPATPAPRTASGGSPSAATQQSRTPLDAFATELAGTSYFYSVGEAETRAGFRVLRVDVTRFPVTKRSQQGFVETFPEIGLPRVRQSLAIAGHDTILQFTQAPDKYRWDVSSPGDSAVETTFGSYRGTLWQFRDQICFSFPTGESLQRSAIVAHACSLGGYSVDDIRHFVEALYFGS